MTTQAAPIGRNNNNSRGAIFTMLAMLGFFSQCQVFKNTRFFCHRPVP